MSTKTPEQDLKEIARKFAERLVQTANDHDPKREAEYQKREDERDAALAKHLKERQAQRKK
jgi:hypothetical protein